jgi:adenosylmethionine-8-amino-7-oxononanoate aminotransferase
MAARAVTVDDASWHERGRVREAIRDNLWIHFTQMAQYQDPKNRPVVIMKGRGSTVWDDQGKEYIDALAGLYSVNAGYGRQEIVDAMAAQLEAIPFVNGFSHASVPAAVLAEKLGKMAPVGGNARVFFTSGGSEAVESALKLAKQYQAKLGFPNRYKTISRRGAYHGTTMGALSVNGLSEMRNDFGPLVPGPGTSICPIVIAVPIARTR